MSVNLLIVSKGHAFSHDSFLTMFAEMSDVVTTLVEQPAAQVILQPENVASYDAVLFYDMSGIPDAGLVHDGANNTGQPPSFYVDAIEKLLDAGKGLVLLNHATFSWPLWPLWREITQSSAMLRAGELDGKQVPGSGYRGGHGPLPNASVKLISQGDHPVLAGLETGFEIADELYLKTPHFESAVTPLLRADYDFSTANFTPPPLAPEEEQQNWQHPQGSDLIAWAHSCRRSPVVVTDLGDGPSAFENPDFSRFIENAVTWVSSEHARRWVESKAC
jgi:hypothetical protein